MKGHVDLTGPTMSPRAVLIVAGGTFLALAVAVSLVGALPGDAWTREALLGWASPAFVAVMRIANHAGSWPVLVPATLLLLFLSPRLRGAWWVWLPVFVLAPLIEGGAKFVVGRTRPEGPAYGFPSGHAAAAAVYFGAVWYAAAELPPRLRHAVRAVAVVVIVLVAMARVILRAH
jgi:membrane-associated phospholipid phosphatase